VSRELVAIESNEFPFPLERRTFLIDNNSVPVTATGPQDRAPPPNNDDRVRWFLARATVALMLLTLVAYLLTKDFTLLGTTTIIGVAVIAVFRYYFNLSSKR
jgi:membrane-bound ClpP family serine protease